MTAKHLSDVELQQYALDKSNCTMGSITHINACASCQAEAAAYLVLFSRIKDQPKPVFDFDLSALVLEQLPNPIPAQSNRVWRFSLSAWLLAILCMVIVGVPLYLFRINLWNMFAGISGVSTYIIFATAIFIVLFRILKMYKKYQRQMESLNFY